MPFDFFNFKYIVNEYEQFKKDFNAGIIGEKDRITLLTNLFNKLAACAHVNSNSQQQQLNRYKASKKFSAEGMEANVRVAFGAVYEYIAMETLKNWYGLSVEYNNSTGNYIDLSVGEEKRVFDIKAQTNNGLWLGFDVKCCTNYDSTNDVFYNTAFHETKLRNMAKFFTQDVNNFVNHSFVFAFVPGRLNYNYKFMGEKYDINYTKQTIDDFVFIIDLNNFITVKYNNIYGWQTTLGNNYNVITRCLPPQMHGAVGIKYNIPAVYTVQDFIDKFVK